MSATAAILAGEEDAALFGRKPKWTRAEIDRTAPLIRRLWNDGKTVREIAAITGLSLACANGRVRKLGGRPDGKRRGGLEAQFEAFVHPEPNSGCWLWGGSTDRKGYGQLRVSSNHLRYATHVALEIAGRPLPAGMIACHHCDNPGCVNPDHLFAGTSRDNTRDMMAKGRHVPPPRLEGEANSSASITAATARRIKAELEAGRSAPAIARDLGIAKGIAYAIKYGKTWRHV